MNIKKRILITPLNWGLGHASRTVVLINELLLQGAEPIIGSDGEALVFLKNQFPKLEFIEMPAYDVKYRYNNMYLNMAFQLASLLRTLKKERSFTRQIVEKYKIDGIISDNRYAVAVDSTPSVFIGHQLNILVPDLIVSKLVNYSNRKLINKFNYVWVPDSDSNDNLSGKLSKGFKHRNIKFVGPMSRLNPEVNSIKDYKIVALLSGPEPQRTYFENIIKSQLLELDIPSILIRGLIREGDSEQRIANLCIKNFADDTEIASLIKGSDLFVARSGYSTIMDLAKVNSGALLLVPTPGQTEQEYLAKRLHQNGAAIIQNQQEMNINNAWNNRYKSSGLHSDKEITTLRVAMGEFLDSIKAVK